MCGESRQKKKGLSRQIGHRSVHELLESCESCAMEIQKADVRPDATPPRTTTKNRLEDSKS